MDDCHLKLISTAIHTVREQYVGQYASFLNESDIQGLLFTKMFDQFGAYSYPFKPKNERWWRTDTEVTLAINPIKMEYGYDDETNNRSKERFDIAFIDSIDSSDSNQEDNWWRAPVRLAIEIKLWAMDKRRGQFVKGWVKDFDKLEKYKRRHPDQEFTGVSLLFTSRCDHDVEGLRNAARKPNSDACYAIEIDPDVIELERNKIQIFAFTPSWGPHR